MQCEGRQHLAGRKRRQRGSRGTSNKENEVLHEIGQVKWIFSDKTGTLTRNEMRLVSVYVDGHV